MIWSDYFYYDADSPSGLRWAVSRFSGNNGRVCVAKAGYTAGCLDKRGRWVVRLNNKGYFCHRVIYELVVGKIPEGLFIDHIDGDTMNNSITNLRLADKNLNARNQKKNIKNTTGFTGVTEVGVGTNSHGYRATWRDLSDTVRTKLFTIRKHGDAALQEAIRYRISVMEHLNAQGAGYTDRHIYGK